MLPEPLKIVLEQAENDGIWFIATSVTEAYLQSQLRLLHAAVENYFEQQGFDFPKGPIY